MRRVEEILPATYVHSNPSMGAVRATIVKGTNTLRFPAYAQFAADTTALTEGTAPTAQELTINSDTVSATQVGWTASLTDLAMEESPNNLLEVATNLIGDQAANSLDVIVRDVLAAGASVKYSNGSARSAVSATLTGSMVRTAVTNLRKRNVPAFSDGYFHVIISPEQGLDLMTDTATGGWLDSLKYTTATPMLTGELGQFFGARFVITSNAKVFATAGASSKDVHSAIFLGTNAFAIGDLQTLRGYYTAPGGQSDPLHQKAIVGAKAALGAGLLDAIDARYVRYETAVTSVS